MRQTGLLEAASPNSASLMLILSETRSSPLTYTLTNLISNSSCWPDIRPWDIPVQTPHSATWPDKDPWSPAGFVPSHLQPASVQEAHHSRFWLFLDLSCLDVVSPPVLCEDMTMWAGIASLIQLTQPALGEKERGRRKILSQDLGKGNIGQFCCESVIILCTDFQPVSLCWKDHWFCVSPGP